LNTTTPTPGLPGAGDIYGIILNGSVGLLAGFAVGYAVKKILKILLFLIGASLALLLYLNHEGLIEIKWEKMKEALTGIFNSLRGALGAYQAMAVSVPLAGFAAGFILGLKYG